MDIADMVDIYRIDLQEIYFCQFDKWRRTLSNEVIEAELMIQDSYYLIVDGE
jgi:hypothetical protein